MKTKMLCTKLEGCDFWYREDDRFIGQRVALRKYEEYETKILLRQLRPRDVVIDVGANIGYYTILMAKRCNKVYAIEPEPENFGILRKNIEVNGLKNVVLINAAVGNISGRAWLKKSRNNYGDHRLVTKNGHNLLTRNDVSVKCLRLDDIILSEQKISLIKSDTQGWEPAVIAGAKKIIDRDYPTMFLEYWPEGADEAGQDLQSMISRLRKIYKDNIWEINDSLWVYTRAGKEISIDRETGYRDLWMKKSADISDFVDSYRNVRIKKFIKKVLRVK